MLHPSTAREALLAELIGDVATLLDRAETITSAINTARQAMSDASRDVVGSVEPWRANIARIRDAAAAQAVERIARRAGDISSVVIEQQRRAMTASARELFAGEVATTLKGLTDTLTETSRRLKRPWEAWFLYAATALASATITATMMLCIMTK